MKKNVKKIILIAFTFIVVILLGAVGIYAANKYYQYKWTNEVTDVWEHNEFVTNDIIEIDDGYIAIGFANDEDSHEPKIRVLNKEGLLKKEVTVSEGEAVAQYKKIFKTEDGYAVFGIAGDYLAVITLSEKFKVNDIEYYDNTGDEFDESETYFEEDENYYYIFDFNSGKEYSWRIDKNFEELETFGANEADDDMYNKANEYSRIFEYEYSKDEEYYYEPVFAKHYHDGMVYGLYSGIENESRIVYYENEEVIFDKTFEGFIRDGDEINNKFVFGLQTEEGSSLLLLDKEGNELMTDSMSNYLTDAKNVFAIEHVIAVGTNGFAVTGTEIYNDEEDDETEGTPDAGAPLTNPNLELDENGNMKKPEDFDVKPGAGETPPEKPKGDQKPADAKAPKEEIKDAQAGGEYEDDYTMTAEVIYFNVIHNVYTKTDGNGTVEANKVEAEWGDAIEFTITPKEGYVLDAVKVTDSDGNVMEFTDYKFTMPNADVTIEVSFYVKNPETYAFIGIAIVAILAVSVVAIYVSKKKLNN